MSASLCVLARFFLLFANQILSAILGSLDFLCSVDISRKKKASVKLAKESDLIRSFSPIPWRPIDVYGFAMKKANPVECRHF